MMHKLFRLLLLYGVDINVVVVRTKKSLSLFVSTNKMSKCSRNYFPILNVKQRKNNACYRMSIQIKIYTSEFYQNVLKITLK